MLSLSAKVGIPATMRLALASLLLLSSCGHTGLIDFSDAGSDGGVLQTASPDAGLVDGGAGQWCAPENAQCLADGVAFGQAGRCCNTRMTCFGANAAAGRMGTCAY